MFIVSVSSSVGALRYYYLKNIDFDVAIAFSIPSVIAVFMVRRFLISYIPFQLFSVAGTHITRPVFFMALFGVIMLIAAIQVLKSTRPCNGIKKQQTLYKRILQGTFIGLLSGFIGVGGGFLIIPILIYYENLSFQKAVGTSLVIISISSFIGIGTDVWQQVHINYLFLIHLSIFSIMGILTGAMLTGVVNTRFLKPAFAWLIFIIGFFVLINTLFAIQ